MSVREVIGIVEFGARMGLLRNDDVANGIRRRMMGLRAPPEPSGEGDEVTPKEQDTSRKGGHSALSRKPWVFQCVFSEEAECGHFYISS